MSAKEKNTQKLLQKRTVTEYFKMLYSVYDVYLLGLILALPPPVGYFKLDKSGFLSRDSNSGVSSLFYKPHTSHFNH